MLTRTISNVLYTTFLYKSIIILVLLQNPIKNTKMYQFGCLMVLSFNVALLQYISTINLVPTSFGCMQASSEKRVFFFDFLSISCCPPGLKTKYLDFSCWFVVVLEHFTCGLNSIEQICPGRFYFLEGPCGTNVLFYNNYTLVNISDCTFLSYKVISGFQMLVAGTCRRLMPSKSSWFQERKSSCQVWKTKQRLFSLLIF